MTGFRRIGAGGVGSLFAVVLMSASCTGGSASPDGAPTGNAGTGAAGTGAAGTGAAGTSGGGTPVAQCKEIVSTLCTRSNTCGMLGVTAAMQAACVNENVVAFGCDRAAMSLTDCLSDVKGTSCSSLFTPDGFLQIPGSCNAPLSSIPRSVAQDKCLGFAVVICEWLAACEGITLSPAGLEDCKFGIGGDLDCAFAIETTATYDQCLAAWPKLACPVDPDGGADGGASDAGNPDADPTPPACVTAITYI